MSDEEVIDEADFYAQRGRIMQERIDAEIAGSNDAKDLEHLRDEHDRARRMEQRARQEVHERGLQRPSGTDPSPPSPPTGPSGEVQHPGGARTGVDEQGRGYEVDSEGQRSDRERFDQFRPGGG